MHEHCTSSLDYEITPVDPETSNVLGLANCTLGVSFTIKLANPRFRNVATSQTGSGGRPLETFFDDQKIFFGLFATLNAKLSHKVLLAKPSTLL
ncbi:hypothetical protein O0I10_011744 [Lichtheimia ornata]|uniref:Uncharacterized protein n=1 Tax=Lichtheimia ornata TaxID=688661 RepID=A0AAD7XTS0_9FUNG|nr:uncharacterized protein O0I10_011744 [Lichtheimia ornata]KAJ8652598.1 hypothetical protein O0I10_011744 [Lichtheimia ornata]